MFKPLLAGTIEDTATIKYPVLASPKLDGIRCLIIDGKAVSRNLKPIPNHHIRTLLEKHLAGISLDGELISGPTFQLSTSAVMGRDGAPDFTYNVFDMTDSTESFKARLLRLHKITLTSTHPKWLKTVEQMAIKNETQLLKYETLCLRGGYEGVMVRSFDGRYKQGRSTLKEGILLKLKRFTDAEAEVIGYEEQMHNGNEATTNELGRTARSSHKTNMTGLNTLGALRVRFNGIEFNIGTGFDAATRSALWANKKALIGKQVKFKYQAVGVLEAPRFPVFLGFRASGDL